MGCSKQCNVVSHIVKYDYLAHTFDRFHSQYTSTSFVYTQINMFAHSGLLEADGQSILVYL